MPRAAASWTTRSWACSTPTTIRWGSRCPPRATDGGRPSSTRGRRPASPARSRCRAGRPSSSKRARWPFSACSDSSYLPNSGPWGFGGRVVGRREIQTRCERLHGTVAEDGRELRGVLDGPVLRAKAHDRFGLSLIDAWNLEELLRIGDVDADLVRHGTSGGSRHRVISVDTRPWQRSRRRGANARGVEAAVRPPVAGAAMLRPQAAAEVASPAAAAERRAEAAREVREAPCTWVPPRGRGSGCPWRTCTACS